MRIGGVKHAAISIGPSTGLLAFAPFLVFGRSMEDGTKSRKSGGAISVAISKAMCGSMENGGNSNSIGGLWNKLLVGRLCVQKWPITLTASKMIIGLKTWKSLPSVSIADYITQGAFRSVAIR